MTGLWIVLAFIAGCSCGAMTLAAIMLALAVNKRADQLAENFAEAAQR